MTNSSGLLDEDSKKSSTIDSESIIIFENISKSYGSNLVLNDINLTINKGEFVTIIGLSGCGKTTLLKMINALIIPNKGTVYVEGQDISNIDKVELRRKIGYVIQDVGLFPHMTVKKNLEYVPKLFKQKPKTVIEPERLMEIVDLDISFLNRFPDELSGGECQRVGIARALAVSPHIILMDEPFGSVDEITRRHLQKTIMQIQKELGITVIFVTHDIEEAMHMGTKVIILNNKGVEQYDTPDQIRANPKSKFVKLLIESS